MVNAYDAVHGTVTGCANVGLDINADLEGTAHYGGPANVDEDGNYYLMDAEGYLWSGSKLQDETYLESEGYLWSGGYLRLLTSHNSVVC